MKLKQKDFFIKCEFCLVMSHGCSSGEVELAEELLDEDIKKKLFELCKDEIKQDIEDTECDFENDEYEYVLWEKEIEDSDLRDQIREIVLKYAKSDCNESGDDDDDSWLDFIQYSIIFSNTEED